MRNFKNWLVVVMLISTSVIFAQTKLTGKIVDETNQPLPGATVVLQGTQTGASSDFDGNFTFETSSTNGTILVSFVGYETKTLTFNDTKNFGTIALNPSAESLDEIIITATSFAIDRKTPVAVSTIRADVIENKLGSQEFPEILKSTPGVYATKAGGGFGDGRLNLRGFNSENVAVMINGVPVNDMENGRVYWSNWAGLADVTSAMQVQRGLGASKVAVPSIGGTINILSKTTDIEKGGSFGTSFGNDGYQKYGATVSTGLLDNGFAATVSASKTKGDGYIDGTEFEGYNYFWSTSKTRTKTKPESYFPLSRC
jgi:outer membrane receptor for Fe3+-dicitrate